MVLKALLHSSKQLATTAEVRYTMVCLSYRGYWTSRGRPSERGLNLDAAAGLRWISELHRNTYADGAVKPVVVLWGQSVGSGIATNLAAAQPVDGNLGVDGLILETPFISIRAMLEAFYPQKSLPYRHLWPLLRNHLDNWANLITIAERSDREKQPTSHIFLLVAGDDEVVPREHGEQLFQRCVDLGLPVARRVVRGALHNEALSSDGSKRAVAQAILSQLVTDSR